MTREKKTLVTVPDSAYRALNVPFDADSKAILQAMRDLFRKDPRRGGQIGNRAQKKLTDPLERIKEDAFCVEIDRPPPDLTALRGELEPAFAAIECEALEDLARLSDLDDRSLLRRRPAIHLPKPEIPYRGRLDRRKKNES